MKQETATLSIEALGLERVTLDDVSDADSLRALHVRLTAVNQVDKVVGRATLARLFEDRPADTYTRHYSYQILTNLATQLGISGVDLLADVVRGASRPTQRGIALKGLWSIAHEAAPKFDLGDIEQTKISPALSEYAMSSLEDLMVDSVRDIGLLADIFRTTGLMMAMPGSDEEGIAKLFVQTVSNSQIALTEKLIDEYEALLQKELPEAFYQKWLTEHPVFLDPLAAQLIPLAPLGLEYRTDYVLRRHDGRYWVIEIERPQDRVFTQANDFSARFTHAYGQVLDFQQWITQHVAYAQSHFPGIRTPTGLLVMGTRAKMTNRQLHKLERWQFNSNSVEVLTFDDLAQRARATLQSVRRVPQPPPFGNNLPTGDLLQSGITQR